MSPSAPLRRWAAVLLFPAVLLLVPSLRSQKLGEVETRKYLDPALKEVLRTDRVDRATSLQVRKAFEQAFAVHRGSTWLEKEKVTVTLERTSRHSSFDFAKDRHGTVSLVDPSQRLITDAERRQTTAFVVDALFSSIRRRSILAEIEPVGSRPIDHKYLPEYLKISLNVSDYKSVAASFDTRFKVEVVTFEKDARLLRLYGGDSNAVGRYFFCCVLRGTFEHPYVAWTDASGLATPPRNLLHHLAVTTVPAGTTAVIGTVADNFADQLGHVRPGGNIQLFVPHITQFPYQNYRLRSWPGVPGEIPEEIIVVSDDRILRFRR